MNPFSKAAQRLRLSLKHIGKEGDGNNVDIHFDSEETGVGDTTYDGDTGRATVHLSSDFGSRATDSRGNAIDEGAGILAHEGDHIPRLMSLGEPTTEQED